MAEVCISSPIPIALDEELIGVSDFQKKTELLQTIQPAFVILKPTLLGGIGSSMEWIQIATSIVSRK
ncbi:MAG: hypothetical protein ACE5HS_11500 [bacterium]